MQKLLDAANPPGRLNYWKAEYLKAYSDEAIDTILHYADRRASPFSKILISHLQGAISRVGQDETAHIHRDAPFLLNINSIWTDPDESAEHVACARDFWTAMQPFSAGGVYVNFLSNEGEDRVKGCLRPQGIRTPGGFEEQVRPNELLPSQPEH
jgi:hypothetical protein